MGITYLPVIEEWWVPSSIECDRCYNPTYKYHSHGEYDHSPAIHEDDIYNANN